MSRVPKKKESGEVELLEVSSEKAEKLRKRILELRGSIEHDYLELGKLLSDVLASSLPGGKALYAEWGFDSFDDYCEKELGFRERKAYYLLDVYRQTATGILPKSAVEEIGWTKAGLLAPLARQGVITEGNVDKWVEKAKSSSYDDLRQTVKVAQNKSKQKGKGKQAPEEIFVFRVGLYKEQHTNWQTALAKAQKITGSDRVPWLVDCIAMAFNAEAFDSKEESLDEVCRRVERVFGVELVALRKDDNEVVFGEKRLKDLDSTPENDDGEGKKPE